MRAGLRCTIAFTLLLSGACDGGAASPAPDAATARDAHVEPPPEITLAGGVVRGERGDGFLAFTGIPYAEPPVGALRWAAPRPHPGWSEPIDATEPPPACPQDALGLLTGGSEDCLFVNVHTPDPLPEDAPVMVWIHGGAFVFGEGLQLDRGTAGDILARRYGVVVVSMNYRLGAFGFVRHAALGSSGNEGFQDQQLALAWVRDHIAAFGGDPENVTIFGESAGGFSVCLHLVAPGSRGLFARAISQSGLCDSRMPVAAEQDAAGVELATALGCESAGDVAACMRGASVEAVQAAAAIEGDAIEILAGRSRRRLWPSVDGAIIPAQWGDAVRAGEAADVPTIIGWNADEGTLFVGLAEREGAVIDEAAYEAGLGHLAARTGLTLESLRDAYLLTHYEDPGAALAAALGHATLACPSRRGARLLAEAGRDVRVYRFEYPRAGFQLPLGRELGAFHSAEIQFVFGHPSQVGRSAFAGDDLALHDAMSARWARFAASGDPEGAGGSAWPRSEPGGDGYLALDAPLAEGTGPDAAECMLWDAGELP